MTAPAPYGPCIWCGQPAWMLNADGEPCHPCCDHWAPNPCRGCNQSRSDARANTRSNKGAHP